MLNTRHSLFVAATLAAIASAALADQWGKAGRQAPAQTNVAAQPATPSPTTAQTSGNAPAASPAAARRGPPRVGDHLDGARLHDVTRPGLYGMSEPPQGSRYGVVDGNLIRYDPKTSQVLSIIRQVERIMD